MHGKQGSVYSPVVLHCMQMNGSASACHAPLHASTVRYNILPLLLVA
jgi:hypothetical protein